MFSKNGETKINEDDNIFGYEVKKILKLKEIDSTFYSFNHINTGAQHIHIENVDNENTFGVAFKTVPTNSTGVAHILEHTVLCGSSRFPVKDPFFSMLKRSLSTFMNAFTSPDWTMYPFSTQNKKDYYNLMLVYLDSVFFPKLDELSFKQEGCRIDFEDPITKKKIVYKGIVYNEMKGAMSSPDQVMNQSLLNLLYPDTTYKNNSGGDPAKIPFLKHRDLKKFHKKYYHPSNSFFYTYGNFSIIDHLEYISENFLSSFNKMDIRNNVPNQKKWKKEKTAKCYYPISEKENLDKRYQVCVAWLTADVKETFEILVLSILEQILLGNAASPLRKVLMDSAIGSSLSDGSGFHAENRDTMFVCGLKDVKASNEKKIKELIFNELSRLVKEGIDKLTIDSVLHQIEISRKEKTNVPYPFGIKILMGISAVWLHGGDPTKILQLDKDLNTIKEAMKKGNFFEKKIEKYFINNKHNVLLILSPNKNMERQEKERVKKELSKIKSKMSHFDLEKISKDSLQLDKRRKEEENLSCLPTLQLDDIPNNVTRVSPSINLSKKHNIIGYNQQTSGVFYVSVITGVGQLKKDLLPLVPFFCYVFSRLGTSSFDYIKIAQKIDLYTGGIQLSCHSRTVFDSNGFCLPFISFNTKCLVRNKSKMLDLIKEMILNINFDEHVRIMQLLLEYKANFESMIVRNGHVLAISMSARNFSSSNHINELWYGITQFHIIKKIINYANNGKIDKIVDQLEDIKSSIFSKNNFKLALVSEKNELLKTKEEINSFLNSLLTNNAVELKTVNLELDNKYFREGWTTSTAVSFVAQTFETVKMEDKDSPNIAVISKIISSMYLHKKIREEGGAYGGFASYNSENGLFSFCSYRDPHIVDTLKVYENISSFISSNRIKEENVKEAILQICAAIDKPDSPAVAAKKDFFRKTVGIKDDVRQNYKTRLLKLKKIKIIETLEKYFSSKMFDSTVVVISNEELLCSANKKMNNSALKIKSI